MTNILIKGRKYTILEFESEQEFEEAVIENCRYLFGKETIYIDTKIRIDKNYPAT